MKIKKSQVKEIIRECLSERCGSSGHLHGGEKGERMFKHIKQGYKGEKSPEDAERIAAATVNKNLEQEQVGADVVADEGFIKHGDDQEQMDKVVDFTIRQIPKIANDPKRVARMASTLYKHHFGKDADPDMLFATVERHLNNGGEVAEAGLTSEESYKVVDPHAYEDQKMDKARTIQTDPEVNEGDDHWIQGAVKHPGRCKHMGSPECPEGSPQYNLAKRFKKGDIHKDNVKESSYKITSKNELDTAKEDKALKIQTEPKVTENHKTQKRSYKTIEDQDNDPNNVRDPDVPQA